ncbi:hypothetical protein HK101_010956 [Irineochytrium annulatum]|nr:hypothetical protein HK101_010956 [Irineochytrium annulatum]
MSKELKSVHGLNPQHLVETIIRGRIFESLYWKEHCFALTAETIIDKAAALTHVGGVHSGILKPTEFICLIMKMLELQPEMSILEMYLFNESHKYLTALAAVYIRLTCSAKDCYMLLEKLLLDKRKLRYRSRDGQYTLTYMDDFADQLLREDRVCDIILPRLTKRSVLVDLKDLEPRISPLEADLEQMEAGEELDDGGEDLKKGDEDGKDPDANGSNNDIKNKPVREETSEEKSPTKTVAEAGRGNEVLKVDQAEKTENGSSKWDQREGMKLDKRGGLVFQHLTDDDRRRRRDDRDGGRDGDRSHLRRDDDKARPRGPTEEARRFGGENREKAEEAAAKSVADELARIDNTTASAEAKKKKKYKAANIAGLFKKAQPKIVTEEEEWKKPKPQVGLETLTVEETNQIRISMGLKPLNTLAGGGTEPVGAARGGGRGGAEKGKSAGGAVSLSVEETNKLREKAGLKPLK